MANKFMDAQPKWMQNAVAIMPSVFLLLGFVLWGFALAKGWAVGLSLGSLAIWLGAFVYSGFLSSNPMRRAVLIASLSAVGPLPFLGFIYMVINP